MASFFVFCLKVIDRMMVIYFGTGIYDIISTLDARRRDEMAAKIPSYKDHVIYVEPYPTPTEICDPVYITIVSTYCPSATTSNPESPTIDVNGVAAVPEDREEPTLEIDASAQKNSIPYYANAASIHGTNENIQTPENAVALHASEMKLAIPSTGGTVKFEWEALVLCIVFAAVVFAMICRLGKSLADVIRTAFGKRQADPVGNAAGVNAGHDAVDQHVATAKPGTVMNESAAEAGEVAEADKRRDTVLPDMSENRSGQDEPATRADQPETSGGDVQTSASGNFRAVVPQTSQDEVMSKWKGSRTPWSGKNIIDNAESEVERRPIAGTSSLSASSNERPDVDNTSPGNVASLRRRWERATPISQPSFSGDPVPNGVKSLRMERTKSAPGSVSDQKAADSKDLEPSANMRGASTPKQRYSANFITVTNALLYRTGTSDGPVSQTDSLDRLPSPLDNAENETADSSVSSEGSEPFVGVSLTDADMMTVD